MELSNLLWITGGVAFFTGLVIGVVLYHFIYGNRGGNNRGRVMELEAELKEYREKISDHFSTSAHLVNRLTDAYRDVHEHLATTANELCEDELTRHRLNDALLGSNAISRSQDPTTLRQPKDYAPKRADSEGTLSESFGVEKSADEVAKERTE